MVEVLPDEGFSCGACFLLNDGRCTLASLVQGQMSWEQVEPLFASRNRPQNREHPRTSCQNGFRPEFFKTPGFKVWQRPITLNRVEIDEACEQIAQRVVGKIGLGEELSVDHKGIPFGSDFDFRRMGCVDWRNGRYERTAVATEYVSDNGFCYGCPFDVPAGGSQKRCAILTDLGVTRTQDQQRGIIMMRRR